MKPTVYVETSVISYLTSRPGRDLVVAAHQEITRQWWQTAADRFELVVSPMVLDELAKGDESASSLRLRSAENIPVLAFAPAVAERVTTLSGSLGLPPKALADIYHIAYCIAYEIDFLATWNCAHIANPTVLRRLRDLSHEAASSFLQL